MKNYNELFTTETTETALFDLIEKYNDDRTNGIICDLTLSTVCNVVDRINSETETAFYADFIALLEVDRKTAFSTLAKTPSFRWLSVAVENDGTYTISKDGKRLAKLANIEKAYQLEKSTEVNARNGHKIPNKAVTIFSASRIYGLTDAFTRNLLFDILKIEGVSYDLAKVKIDGETIFTEKDGKCFASSSKTALDQQVNIIVKFFGLDVTLRKADLPIIRQQVLKIKRDKDTGKFSAKEQATFAMLDIIFGVMCSRIANEDIAIEVKNNEGKYEVLKEKEVKSETENTTK